MPYGFQVTTTTGLRDLIEVDTARVVWRSRRTTSTGSVTLSTSLTNDSFIFADVNDGGREPNVSINYNNGVVSWTEGSTNSNLPPSTDFVLFLVK